MHGSENPWAEMLYWVGAIVISSYVLGIYRKDGKGTHLLS